MPFNCEECDKEVMTLWYLSSYGCTKHNTKDDGEYCEKCFNKKFEEKHDKDK